MRTLYQTERLLVLQRGSLLLAVNNLGRQAACPGGGPGQAGYPLAGVVGTGLLGQRLINVLDTQVGGWVGGGEGGQMCVLGGGGGG